MSASASRAWSITSEAVLHSASHTSYPASAKTRCSGSMLSWSQSVITIVGEAAFNSPSFPHRGPILRFHFGLLVAHLVLLRWSRLESSLEHCCRPNARTRLLSVKSLLPSSRRPDDARGHQTTALV